jgi:hypothetical protein
MRGCGFSGPRRFAPGHCRARSGPARSMPRRGTRSSRRATQQVFAGLKSWPRLRSRIGHAHPAALWLTRSYPSRMPRGNDRGPGGPCAFEGRRTVRRRPAPPLWGRQAVRHVRIAGIQGGRCISPCSCRTSGTEVGLQNRSMRAPLSGGNFARSAVKRDQSSGGCG